jgi:hypothetical protein
LHRRDDYASYYIEINVHERFQVELNDYPDIETAAKIFNEQLDKLTSQRFYAVAGLVT